VPVQTIEKTIDGHAVKIVQFHAVRGFKLKARLVKFLLPVVAPLAGEALGSLSSKNLAEKASILEQNIDLEKALPQAFSSLAETLDENTFLRLMLDLLAGSFVDGQSVDEKFFNDFFIGNYMLAYKIAIAVVTANSFFDFGDIGSLLQPKETVVDESLMSPEK